jgi:hypothetical protein
LEVYSTCEVGLDEPAVGGKQPVMSPSDSGEGPAVRIYPIPSSNSITIELPDPSPQFQISIFNLSGQELIHKNSTGQEAEIDISSLSRGLYFVRLTVERTVRIGKFVKE